MSPPGITHRPEQGASGPSGRALSSRTKILLATSIVLLGSASALPFRKDNFHESGVLPMNEQTVAVSLQPLAAQSTIGGEGPLPANADNAQKYAAAYPEPLLRSGPVGSEFAHADGKIVKEISVPYREFKAIPAFSKSSEPFLERNAGTFGEQPMPVAQSRVVDGLLPVFSMADNLKPLSKSLTPPTLPDNPFQTNPAAEQPAPAAAQPKLTSLRPSNSVSMVRIEEDAAQSQTSIRPLVELRSLKLPKFENNATN